jgi:hypothetical protein
VLQYCAAMAALGAADDFPNLGGPVRVLRRRLRCNHDIPGRSSLKTQKGLASRLTTF